METSRGPLIHLFGAYPWLTVYPIHPATSARYRAAFKPSELEERKMQYLYPQDTFYYFMDHETYEQIPLTSEQLGDVKLFLKENTEVKILNYKPVPLNVELPTFMELVVAKTDPGFKGDTASGGGKPATLETGAVDPGPFPYQRG